MPSTDRKLELTAKASMAQPVSQTAVCSNGLIKRPSGQQGVKQKTVISNCFKINFVYIFGLLPTDRSQINSNSMARSFS